MCKDCRDLCSVDDVCSLCDQKLGIQAEQEGAQRKQHNKVEKMQVVSNLHLKKAEVGDIVMVPIPLVDRRRAEFPNVKVVELQVDKSGAQEFEMRRWIFKQEICSLLVSSISCQLTTWPRKERYAFVKQEMQTLWATDKVLYSAPAPCFVMTSDAGVVNIRMSATADENAVLLVKLSKLEPF